MLPILQRRWGALLLLWLGLCLSLPAQITLGEDFATQLDQHKLDFVFAQGTDYRPYRHCINEFMPTDFAMRSRSEHLQIRYLIEPLDSTHYLSYEPHLLASGMIMHLGKNEREAVVTMHELPDEQAQRDFGADWAAIYFFPPKKVFSDYAHCRMLVLYREAGTMAYVFYLFNEPSPALNDRLHTLHFREEQVVLGDD